VDINSAIQSVVTLLWALTGIIGAVIIFWFVWQLLQIGRALKEYGVDYIGFLRGEVHTAAEAEGVDILTPTLIKRRGRIQRIIAEKNKDKEDKTKKSEKKD
jgi:type VI protein secretion system component VasK